MANRNKQKKRRRQVQPVSRGQGMEQQRAAPMQTAQAAPNAVADPRAMLMQLMQQRTAAQAAGTPPGAQMDAQPGAGMMEPRRQMMQMALQRRAQAGMMQPGMQTGMGQRAPQNYTGSGFPNADPVHWGQPQALVDSQRVREATQVLRKYMAAKRPIDERVRHAQEWWRQRNWKEIELTRGTVGTQPHKSATGWLKTSIIGKHADFMEAYPEPIFLARNPEDEAEARHLSEIVPVILKKIDFEETYSKVGWQKNIEGTGIYGVTWDGQAENGMGEICIKRINALNIFAEPGMEDIQESANVFCVRMESNDRLLAMYPQLEGKLGSDSSVEPTEYEPIENKDKGDKTPVVDWYYKKWVNGREVLHYCQYVNDVVLYSSENERPDRGHYDHGLYPFIPDVLLPDSDCMYGQGLVDEAKDTQMDVDEMNQAMVTTVKANSTTRYFMRQDGGVNPEQFLDFSQPIVNTNASLGDDTIRQIETKPLDGNSITFYTSKVEELKTITGNTDVVNGEVPSSVTSGVMYAAMKEDSGRQSKDSNRTSYRAMKKLYLMVVELMRQFYSMDRQFRIVGEDGMVSYIHYQNQGLQLRTQMTPYGMSYRRPEFDVDVHVQRENAYTRMALNDLATQFYQMGLFNPMQAPQALSMLQMMEFTGKEKLVKLIQQNFMQTMMMMGGSATGTMQPQLPASAPAQEGSTTPTEEDATEAGTGRNAQAHSPATDRMRQRVNDAVRP